MCNSLKNRRTQLVEIVVTGVPSTGNQQQRIQFVDQPYLRYKKIYGLEMFNINDLILSPQTNPVVDEVVFNHGYLTLYTTDVDDQSQQGEWMQLIPLWKLHNLQNANGDTFERQPFLLDGQTIIWEKSYITLSAPIGNTVATSFLINVSFSGADIPHN